MFSQNQQVVFNSTAEKGPTGIRAHIVSVLPEHSYDRYAVGTMYRIVFNIGNGWESTDAFEDELVSV